MTAALKPLAAGLTLAASLSAFAQADDFNALFGDGAGQEEATPADPRPDTPRADAQPDPTPIELPTTTQPAPAPAPKRRVIDEIVVTATKREASVRDIPASITALRGEELEQAGAQGMDDFVKLSPGVTIVDGGYGLRQVTVRGISAGALTSNTTGTLIGDVPFNDPYTPRVTLDPNPFDLATVEILKGPQGTLFGGSALNGAIRYVPTAPVLGQWEGRGFAQYSAVEDGDSGLIFGGVVNLPLGDTAALRLVGHSRNDPGWVDEVYRGDVDINELHQLGGRLLGTWQPSERWELTATLMAQDTETDDMPFSDPGGQRTRSSTPVPSPGTVKYDLQTIGINYAFDSFHLTSLTSRNYKLFDTVLDVSRIGGTDRPPPALMGPVYNESTNWIQEFRLTSNPSAYSRWEWLAGAFFFSHELFETIDLFVTDQALPVGSGPIQFIPGISGTLSPDGRPNAAHTDVDLEFTELALFGEATRHVGQALDLTLGLRVYRIESTGLVVGSGSLVAPNSPPGETELVSPGDFLEQGVNPRLAARYTFSDQFAAHASISRGFRFGGPQLQGDSATSDVPDTFKPDTIWNYELGVRSQWLNDSLLADLTLFWADWQDPQIQQSDPVFPKAFVDNVGGARSRGFEMAVQYLTPLDGLSLSVSAAHVDIVTTEAFTSSSGAEIPPGTPWPRTARWQTSSSIAYARPVGNWTTGASLQHSYSSRGWLDLEQSLELFDYHTLDLQFTLSNPGIAWLPELTLNVSNLTDERGLIGGSGNLFPNEHYYIRPRAVMLRLVGNLGS